MGSPRSVTVGTAGDGREAQQQEVGSNFRNTTGNTIDILSAIDFAKRLQAAATSGKEAMPNEQSKVYTRRPLAFEKLCCGEDGSWLQRRADLRIQSLWEIAGVSSLALWCLGVQMGDMHSGGPDGKQRSRRDAMFSFLLFVFLACFFFLLILACFSFLVILACFSSICYSWLRGSERATETRRWRRPQKSDSSPEAVGRSFCEEEWRCVHRSSVAENCDDHSADAIATAVRTGEAEGWFGSIGEVAVPPTPTPPPTHPPTQLRSPPTHPHSPSLPPLLSPSTLTLRCVDLAGGKNLNTE